jgi:hypothetical protein
LGSITEKFPSEGAKARTEVGILLEDCFQSIDGEVMLSTGTNLPIFVEFKDKNMDIEYFLAPYVEGAQDAK